MRRLSAIIIMLTAIMIAGCTIVVDDPYRRAKSCAPDESWQNTPTNIPLPTPTHTPATKDCE